MACPARPPWRAGRPACWRPPRAASRAAVVTAPRRAAAILESTSEEVSTADSGAYAVSALPSALEACRPEMEAHHGGHERLHRPGQQRHAGHGGVQLRPQDGGGPALPRHSGEDHAAGGQHQGGQRSLGSRHRRSAGLRAGQLQVHAVRGALHSHHALQHVVGRLVCLVGETRGQRAL